MAGKKAAGMGLRRKSAKDLEALAEARASTPHPATALVPSPAPVNRATRKRAANGAERKRVTVLVPVDLAKEIRQFAAAEEASISFVWTAIARAGFEHIKANGLPEPDED